MNSMKITSTIITRIAEATSDNASYYMEYSITDGMLERVQTTIYEPTEGEQRIAVGNVYYDRGSITANMPFSQKMSDYIKDVTGYIETILADVSATQSVSDLQTNNQ